MSKFIQMLLETPQCKGLERVEESRSCSGIQVCKEKHIFSSQDVLIIRSQWSKTQGGWNIRVNNFYADKHHFLQVPVDTLKQCKEIIETLKKEGIFSHWMGFHIKPGSFTQGK